MTDAAIPRFRSEARRPWLLLAPALILLIVLLVLPILVMLRFTFYEFVTAGVERNVMTAANWREFECAASDARELRSAAEVGSEARRVQADEAADDVEAGLVRCAR